MKGSGLTVGRAYALRATPARLYPHFFVFSGGRIVKILCAYSWIEREGKKATPTRPLWDPKSSNSLECVRVWGCN
jgi:hypothetical protein